MSTLFRSPSTQRGFSNLFQVSNNLSYFSNQESTLPSGSLGQTDFRSLKRENLETKLTRYLPIDSEQDQGPQLYLQKSLSFVFLLTYCSSLKSLYFFINSIHSAVFPQPSRCVLLTSQVNMLTLYKVAPQITVFQDWEGIPPTNSLSTCLLYLSFSM